MTGRALTQPELCRDPSRALTWCPHPLSRSLLFPFLFTGLTRGPLFLPRHPASRREMSPSSRRVCAYVCTQRPTHMRSPFTPLCFDAIHFCLSYALSDMCRFSSSFSEVCAIHAQSSIHRLAKSYTSIKRMAIVVVSFVTDTLLNCFVHDFFSIRIVGNTKKH